MKQLIIDAAMNGNSGEAIALMIANRLMATGQANILALTSSAPLEESLLCSAAINSFYGHKDIPLGKISTNYNPIDNSFLPYNPYIKKIVDSYFEGNEPFYKSAIELMRETLAGAKEKVTIVTLGPLTNIYRLILSEPDDYSSLTGTELIHAKVDRFVVAAGCFDTCRKTDDMQGDIRLDLTAAHYMAAYTPVPIVFCGTEIGIRPTACIDYKKLSLRNPVRMIHSLCTSTEEQPSNYLPAMLYAARSSCGLWSEKKGLSIQISETGRTSYLENGGRHVVLQHFADDNAVSYALSLICCPA